MPLLQLHKIRLQILSPQPCELDLGNYIILDNAREYKRKVVSELLSDGAEIDPNSDLDLIRGVCEFPTAFLTPPATGRFKFILRLDTEPPSDLARIYANTLTIYSQS